MVDMRGYYENEKAENEARKAEADCERMKLAVSSPWTDVFVRLWQPVGITFAVVVFCAWASTTCKLQLERENVRNLELIEVKAIEAQAHLIHGFVTTTGVAVATKEASE